MSCATLSSTVFFVCPPTAVHVIVTLADRWFVKHSVPSCSALRSLRSVTMSVARFLEEPAMSQIFLQGRRLWKLRVTSSWKYVGGSPCSLIPKSALFYLCTSFRTIVHQLKPRRSGYFIYEHLVVWSASASVAGASSKLGEWLSTRFFSMG